MRKHCPRMSPHGYRPARPPSLCVLVETCIAFMYSNQNIDETAHIF